MKPKIAVFGAGDIGHIMAADLTFAGYDVSLLELSEFKEKVKGIQQHEGIHLTGRALK